MSPKPQPRSPKPTPRRAKTVSRPVIPAPTVAALLSQAQQAHAAYRRLAVTGRKPSGWQAHLWDAYTLRQRAHTLDPAHADPAWDANHDALMSFYRQQLGVIESRQ